MQIELTPLFSVGWELLADFPYREESLFHMGKILFFLALYLIWARAVMWVDFDTRRVDMPAEMWNMIMLAAGVVGIGLVWFIPNFGFAAILQLLFFLSAFIIYCGQRDQVVPPKLKVLTPEAIKKNVAQMFTGKIDEEEEAPEKEVIPIRFIGKSQDERDEDENRVNRASESPGYRNAEELVYEALQSRATDIHMEPTRDEMTVRFRIDSILQSVPSFSRGRGDTVLNVYKVLAGLDITEKRKPQDGSFSAEVEGERRIDFRVATAGSVNGEKMVMRILDSSRQFTGLSNLGFRDNVREKLETIIHQPYGLLLTTGPTGAGKTSTLYACLHEIDRYQLNVITLENPVEYQIDNVTQIEINPKAGKTFATELRSILRQDPDVILVGEIRDAETAEIACQAAQTGHMVLSTLHANDSITAIGRMIDLGVKPFMIGSALSGVLAQRLVRLLCPKCKKPYRPETEVLQKLKLPPDKIKQFYRAPKEVSEEERDIRLEGEDEVVCENCRGIGYFGRTGIFEFLVVNTEIRDQIRSNPDLGLIRQMAQKAGMATLMQDGLRKVIEGKTSLDEVQRVAR